MMGGGIRKRKSKRGFAQSIYLQYDDEDMIDTLMAHINMRHVYSVEGEQYTSFSAFVRDAIVEKLERGAVRDEE